MNKATIKATPLFSPNGDGYDIQPAGLLMLMADIVYKNPDESTPTGRESAAAMIDSILAAARAGGFKQCDILATLLVRGEISQRVRDMAIAACDAAGADQIDAVFAAMRERIKGAD